MTMVQALVQVPFCGLPVMNGAAGYVLYIDANGNLAVDQANGFSYDGAGNLSVANSLNANVLNAFQFGQIVLNCGLSNYEIQCCNMQLSTPSFQTITNIVNNEGNVQVTVPGHGFKVGASLRSS